MNVKSKITGIIAKKELSKPGNKIRILLFPRTGLGNLIQFTPFLSQLRKMASNAFLHLVVRNKSQYELVSKNPNVDKITVCDVYSSTVFSLLRNFPLWRRILGKSDLAFTGGGLSTAFLARITGAKVVLGFISDEESYRSRVLCRIVFSFRIPVIKQNHEVMEYLRFLAFLPQDRANLFTKDLETSIYVTSNDREKVASRVRKYPRISPTLIIHPGGDMPGKLWPPKYFAQICQGFSGRVILVGGEKEVRVANEIINISSGSRILNLTGQTSLGETVALFEQADLVLSNDNVAAHIAAAVDKPCVAVFGPTDERNCGPWSKNALIIKDMSLACRPCYRLYSGVINCTNPDTYLCLKLVKPAIVFEAIEGLVFRGLC